MDQLMFEEWNYDDSDFMEDLDDMFSVRKMFERIKSNFFLFLFLISKK